MYMVIIKGLVSSSSSLMRMSQVTALFLISTVTIGTFAVSFASSWTAFLLTCLLTTELLTTFVTGAFTFVSTFAVLVFTV
ncbi:hypothetical protein GCK72_017976 [Caenorhabditis remanei]|uniref:Uncharacterized protein n=1 Tax=Caenorhabditis remanei TaxID=31234 RepID=A0A6A5GA66_CAERE|nr:hypothetical protein GCK72_017976 [Caenorhabditis remanei]KAF1751422.1 hypothetical protein GCK72_017976 [Caenorhabditis remanei]